MVYEIVENAELVFYELEGEDRLLEAVCVINLLPLVTAAGQDSEDNEEWDSDCDEKRMLEQVDDKVGVEVRNRDSFGLANLERFLPRLDFPLDEVNRVADDGGFDSPLAKGPRRAALVTAGRFEAAEAEDEVEDVEDAISKGDTLHLRVEADVEQKGVEEQVEGHDHHRDYREGNTLPVFVIQLLLCGDRVDEPQGATEDQSRPNQQEDQLCILEYIVEAEGGLSHLSVRYYF